MISPRTALVGVVGAGCMAAAGIGGYLAVRSSAATNAAPARLEPPVTASPVRVTEATVSDQAPVAAPAPKATISTGRDRQGPAAATRPAGEPPPSAPGPARSSAIVEEEVADQTSEAVDAYPPAPDSVATPSPRVTAITIKPDSVIGIRLDAPISSETARIEDPVSARVMRDVTVDGDVGVPEGARLQGTVTTVERGGKFKDRARIGIRFHLLVLADRSRIPIQTDAIFRDGEAPGGEAASKVGASAVVAAILGGIVGGKKGAAIGTVAGAAGGTAAVMAGGPNPAVIPAGTPLTVRLLAPVSIEIERHE